MNNMLEGEMIIRSDSMGDGHYLAPRGNRVHLGEDFVVIPGENILMPFDGKLIREARPYPDSELSGAVIQGKIYTLKVFYFEPFLHFNDTIPCGTIIGKAQDIRIKWGSKMTPHIHVQVEHMAVSKVFGI